MRLRKRAARGGCAGLVAGHQVLDVLGGFRLRRPTHRLLHVRRHAELGEALVQRGVDAGDRRYQVAFAQLDDDQPHFRRQVAGREALVHRDADVFGAHGVVFGFQRRLPGQPAEAAVQARQHRLAVAQDHAGQVAHGQAGFQLLVGHQGEGVVGRVREGAFHRQRATFLQCLPGELQVGTEAHDDVFAPATQLAHGIQERHLRRTRTLGTVEQRIVETAECHREGVHQRRNGRVARLVKHARFPAGTIGDIEDVRHAQGSPPWQAKGVRGGGPESATPS